MSSGWPIGAGKCGSLIASKCGQWGIGGGSLYFYANLNYVYVTTPSGGSYGVFAGGLANDNTWMVLDSSGNLFVVQAGFGNGVIYKFTPSGSRSTFATLAYQPGGVCIDASDNLYVSRYANLGNSIYKYTPGGSSSVYATGLIFPGSSCIDSSDNLYVVTGPYTKITKIDSGGTQTTFATTTGYFSGLAVDVSGNVYVTTSTANTILKITPAGSSSTYATGLSNPTLICIDKAGNLYTSQFSIYAGASSIAKVTTGSVVSTFISSLTDPYGLTCNF